MAAKVLPGARDLSFSGLDPVSESLLLLYTGTVMASIFFSTSCRRYTTDESEQKSCKDPRLAGV